MSNDHYYVVIVPHADQAAQAVTLARGAVAKGPARHEPASHREPTGKPASHREPTGKPASYREPAGKPASHRGVAGTPRSQHTTPPSSPQGRVGGGYVGGTDHHLRTWSVVVDDDKYNVHDFGTSCGYRIDCEGTTVWTGVLGRRGQYDTHTTTLTAGKLNEVLRLVYVGDQRHAQARAPQSARTAPPSATHTAKPKGTRRAKASANAAPPTSAPPSSATRPVSSKAKPPKSVSHGLAAAPVRAKRAAKSATSHPHGAPASRSGVKASENSKAKRHAKPKTVSGTTQAGPLTQRTPVSPPSAKPSSRRAASHVDDTAVLREIKANLHKGDPATAETHFEAMERIWRGGGREATVAWMAKHPFPSVVDAFDDWMEKNVDAARAMLHDAPKHEQVA